MKCDGCGKDVQCAQYGPPGEQAWLGYSCGCGAAWAAELEKPGVTWQLAKKWAGGRRKQVAS